MERVDNRVFTVTRLNVLAAPCGLALRFPFRAIVQSGNADSSRLKGRDGDRINVVLAAAGFNFSLLLRWFEELLRFLLLVLCRHLALPHFA
jgi:hypothetical protein